ncbi:MAG: hypothetical protein WC438_06315 [Candidatus Pacearchaeota archaeon]
MKETKITLSLLVKLLSVVVHSEELMSPKGHIFDKKALETLLTDDEVRKTLEEYKEFLPLKR